jgi:pyruvate-formate lyase-activating enzyme
MISGVNFVDIETVKEAIRNSLPFIDSVCFSGGEPTMQPEPLENLLRFSHSLELETMVETNGYFPDVLIDLYEQNLVDHLFIDIKTTEENYTKITGKEDAYRNLLYSLKVQIPHTTRTTIFKNIKIPKCSQVLQQGLLRLSPDKSLEEYTLEEFERLIHK